MSENRRFGNVTQRTISEAVRGSVPLNTRKTKISIWKQFQAFCNEKEHKLQDTSSLEEIAHVLEDWAFNMKKGNGDDYKECVVKTMWNVTAKMVQEMYYKNHRRVFDPFTDIIFKAARDARNAKRKQLQCFPEKRKASSLVLTTEEYNSMVKIWDEETPLGLQRKFFHIASRELAWKSSNEAANCLVQHFRKEVSQIGLFTGRIEYNRSFSYNNNANVNVNNQFGRDVNKSESKYLTPNPSNPDFCPVRLFNKVIEKRNERIVTDRLFLTVNPFWADPNSSGWFKNMPVGKNEVAKWTKYSAEMLGLDSKRLKMLSLCRGPDHNNAGTVVDGMGDQQLVQLLGPNANNMYSVQYSVEQDDSQQAEEEEVQAYTASGTQIKAENYDDDDDYKNNPVFDDPLVESTTVGDSLSICPSLESTQLPNPPNSEVEDQSRDAGMKNRLSDSSIIIGKLDRIESVLDKEKSETEFDIFGRSVSMQLNKMPLNDGLQLQLRIQQVITEFRLTKCGANKNNNKKS